MKQKLLSLLLSVAVLALSGCGGLSAEDVLDIADTVLSGGDAGIVESDDGPTEVYLPEKEDTPGGEEDPAGEEGTSDGEEELYQDPAGEDEDGELPALAEDGTYNSAEDVSLYLHLYEHLPENYITKSEARDLGWTGGSVERYAPGCAIGGDSFGNREGLLPSEEGRRYYECDIDTIGRDSRGAKRIIFSNDGLIYYTEDHYESFTLLYGEE